MAKLTNGFVVLDENGEDHTHPLFNNLDGTPKIFTSQGDVVNEVNDFNRDVEENIVKRLAEWRTKFGLNFKDPIEPFYGSIIVANVLTFQAD